MTSPKDTGSRIKFPERFPLRSSERTAYNDARRRCTNPTAKAYRHYGGRGIRFLFTSFEQFIACLGPKPAPKLTLEQFKHRLVNDPNLRGLLTRADMVSALKEEDVEASHTEYKIGGYTVATFNFVRRKKL